MMKPLRRHILTLATCILSNLAASVTAHAQGAFTHEIPIKIPPGTHGMQPALSLAYNSTYGNGIVGMGWSLQGLSSITRVNYGTGINYDGSDTFAHSQLGILVRQADGTYRTKKETFAKLERQGICGDGPCSWVMSDSSGLRYYYGDEARRFPEDTRLTPADSDLCLPGQVNCSISQTACLQTGQTNCPMQSVRTWALKTVVDPFGNYFEVTYANDNPNGQLYPKEIAYTLGCGQSQIRTVEFLYENRNDVGWGYGGGAFGQTLQVLKWIVVKSGGFLVRKYGLEYETGTTNRSRLKSFQEYGSDGSALPPQTFEWLDRSTEFVDRRNQWAADFLTKRPFYLFSGDWYGYGNSGICGLTPKSGIQCLNYSSLTELRNDSDDNGSAAVAAFPLVVGDWNGDGKSDVCRVNEHGVVCYTSTGKWDSRFPWFSGWLQYPTLGDLSPGQGYDESLLLIELDNHNKYPIFTGDWNADGKTDLCRVGDTGVVCYTSTGNGWERYWAIPDLSDKQGYADEFRNPVLTGDWNGDGRTDVCRVGDTSLICYASTVSGWKRYSALGDLAPDQDYSESRTYPIVTGDWNADGKTDICRVGKDNTICYVSSGTGWARFPILPNFSTQQQAYGDGSGRYPIFSGDIDGDGRTDICRVGDTGLFCYRASDSMWERNEPFLYSDFGANRGYPDSGKCPMISLDLDGDGLMDFCRIGNSDDNKLWLGELPCAGRASAGKDLLSTIHNGLGGTVSMEYVFAHQAPGGVIDPGSSAPGVAFSAPQMLLRSVTSDDGAGHALTTTYEYHDVRWLPGTIPERRLLGFRSVQQNDTATGQFTITEFNQEPGKEGTVAKIETYAPGTSRQGDLLSRTIFDYEVVKPNSGTEVAREVKRTIESYEMGSFVSSQTIATTFDDNGKATPAPEDYRNPRVVVMSADGLPTVTTTTNYENDTTNWILGKAMRVTTTSNTGMLADYMNEEWRANIVTRRSDWLDTTGKYLPTQMKLDECGNVQSVTEPTAADGLVRQTTFLYDEVFHAYPTQKIDALGHVETTRYNNSGLATERVDENGWLTSWEYDASGRRIKETRADGGSTSYRYLLRGGEEGSFPRLYNESTTSVDRSRAITRRDYLDGSGFVYASEYHGDNGRWLCVENRRDSAGRVSDTSLPYVCGSVPVFSHTTYDRAGRLSTVTAPDGRVTQYSYGVRYRTVTDSNGNSRRTYVDARGRVTIVVDAVGNALTYGYDPLGRQTSVTLPTGSRTGVAYDSLGRKTRIDDPQLGTTRYEYDEVGNTIRVIVNDAPSSYVYDALNRVTLKTPAGEAAVTYGYDDLAMANGQGRLTSINDAAGTVLLSYTPNGQLNSSARYFTGEAKSYTQYFRYDLAGRVTRETYPTGDLADYSYTFGGNLASVALNGVALATWSDYSPTGKPGSVKYGNGVQTAYQFDVMDHVTSLRTTSQTAILQDLGYDWYSASNTNGMNIGSISDNRVNKIVNGNNTDESQSYTYDPLYRLATAVGVWGTKTFDYDSIGNPRSFGGVTNRTLMFNGQQLSSGTGISEVRYDGRGNLEHKAQDGLTWDYSWTAENRLATASRNGVLTAQMLYDDAGQRARKIYTPSTGPSVTTLYLGKSYERRTYSDGSPTRHTLHVYANGQHIATVTRAGDIATAFNERNEWRTELATAALYNGRSLRGIIRKASHVLAAAAIHPRASEGLIVLCFVVFGVVLLVFCCRPLTASMGGISVRTRLLASSVVVVFAFASCSRQGGLYEAPNYLLTGDTANGPALGTYFFHTNQVNSSAVITDAAGNESTRIVYLPFGEVSRANSSGSDAVTAKFTDQEFDSELGLYYYGARYYDPSVGRFLSADSVVPDPSDAQSFNRYSYVLNKPITSIDPTGHFNLGGFLVGLGVSFLGGILTVCGFGIGLPLLASGLATMGYAAGADPAGISPLIIGAPFGGGASPDSWAGSTTVFGGSSSLSISAYSGALGSAGTGRASGYGAMSDAPSGLRFRVEVLSFEGSEPGETAAPTPSYSALAASGWRPVGQPGVWESMIPIWGSVRAAVDDYQNGRYGWAVFNAGLAVSDVFLMKAVVVGLGKVAAGTAFKVAGSHSWGATRAWLGKSMSLKKGQEVHHWLLERNQGIGKYARGWLKNQPWNLMVLPETTGELRPGWGIHRAIETAWRNGNLFEWFMIGTPQWFKAASLSGAGHAAGGVREANADGN